MNKYNPSKSARPKKRYADLIQKRSIRSRDKKLYDNNLDYTGEIGIILINTSLVDFEIHVGDRIAQMVINPIVQGQWLEVAKLDKTERNSGGFGHTGVQ